MTRKNVIWLLVFISIVVNAYEEEYSCQNTICSPKAGDLLIGRDSALQSTSTCGLENLETYCVVTTGGKSHCKECFSTQSYNPITNPNSHRIGNVISRVPSDQGRWWQSVNALHNVSILLNLETQFQFISTIMRFKTFRPAAMLLERSDNFGQTWRPYAYFSNNCPRDFPQIPERPRKTLNDVTCTSVYSQLTPSEGGVVAFMAAPSEMHANLPIYSEERQNLTAITNLRVTFTRLNTLGDMQLDDSEAIKRKYYYAIYEWNVWGRCSCFGHATRCKAKSLNELSNMEKVYGVCECTHNTAGDNCERCADFYQAKPWQPATRVSANACERCQCNRHSSMCFFSPILYLESHNVSGGHCYQCQHQTEGVQCEFCKPGFYRHPSFPMDHPQTCQPCNCHTGGSEDSKNCEQYTNEIQNTIAGRCSCKRNVGGDKCDRCKVGYWKFDTTNPDGCNECKCHMLGTLDNSGCDQTTGMCTCKRFVGGENCDKCLSGYFNLTSSSLGCQPCACSPYGAIDTACDQQQGICRCKAGFVGRGCDSVQDGYYIHEPEKIIDQPGIPIDIAIKSPDTNGTYVLVLKVDPKKFSTGDNWKITIDPKQINSNCRNKQYTANVRQDTRKIILVNVCFEANKKTFITILPDPSAGKPFSDILFTDIIVIPDNGDPGRIAEYCEQYRELAEQIAKGLADPGRMQPRCLQYFLLPQNHWKESGAVAIPCRCNVTGSIGSVCDKLTGQCPCKRGVTGIQCDQCVSYHYHFSASGCTDCKCNKEGSTSMQCNIITSHCPCRARIEGRQCDTCENGYWKFPRCQRCRCNGFSDLCDKTSGTCLSCRNNTGGVNCESCMEGYYGDPLNGIPCKPCACPGGGVNNAEACTHNSAVGMVCHCKRGYKGARCSECYPNFFGNPTEIGGSCKPCECSGNLPAEGGCDQVTGSCLTCLHNTEGSKCEQCKSGFWGNALQQRCRECECYMLGTVGGSETPCDRSTGVCPCLPNVIGPRCYECAPNHFNLTAHKGCEACNCDPVGSLSPECHPTTGACRCKPDRSGRKCDLCQRTYFGDPSSPKGCQRCLCERSGSLSNICDPASGKCKCRPGISGLRCDRCDRGTTGKLPNCYSCGECWTNWDKAIDEVVNKMKALKNQTASQLPSDLEPLFDVLTGLVLQIELIPGANLTQLQLNRLDETMKLIGNQIEILSKNDGSTGLLKDAIDVMTNLRVEQLKVEAAFQKNENTFKDISKTLEKMMESSHNNSMQDPHGAYAALMRAREDSQRIKAIQRNIEDRKSSLETLHQSAFDKVEQRAVADEEFKRLTKQLSERINDLEDEIRQINRLLCGDNAQIPNSKADTHTCPSACGGASCDPVSPTLFSLEGEMNPTTSSSNINNQNIVGIRSGCASALGCSQGSDAIIRALLSEHLQVQNELGAVLMKSTRVQTLVSGVNSSREEAENVLTKANHDLEQLSSRLNQAHILTDLVLKEAELVKSQYANLTLQRYSELTDKLKSLHHTADLSSAIVLGEKLQTVARRLHDEIEQIFVDTKDDVIRTDALLNRAKRIRDNAANYLDQMNQLKEINVLYDSLNTNGAYKFLEDVEFKDISLKVSQGIERLEQDVETISKDISSHADKATQNSATAQRLVEETDASNRLAKNSKQNLQIMESKFVQLDEKMKSIDKSMKKIVGENGGSHNETENGGSDDPGELTKQVNEFIEKLEQNLKDLNDLKIPLENMEETSLELTEKLEKTVKNFNELSASLSRQTKYQRFCS